MTTPWADVRLSTADWAEAFRRRGPGTPHNQARAEIVAELAEILVDKLEDVSADELWTPLLADRELMATLLRTSPLLDPADLVGDLWSVPAYLRTSAP